MAKEDNDNEEVALLEEESFEFAAANGRKRMHAECCSMVDAEGTEVEARFKAALELGESIQMRRRISAKSLGNVYRYAMDQVLKSYSIPKTDEEPLKKLFLRYWKYAPELRVALGEMPEVKPSVIRRNWNEKTRDESSSLDGRAEPLQNYPAPEEVPYHFSREAGVR